MDRFCLRLLFRSAFLFIVSALYIGAAAATELRIVGGLAGVNQYKQLEEPFWKSEIGRLSNGRLSASISPFDRSGLKGQEMLQLMRLGVVQFGTAILSLADTEDPQLNAIDLSGLNTDIGSLKRSVAAYRPFLERTLLDRYGIVLLAVYAYPAQVLFCTNEFTGLSGLAGRKVRTSSVSQSDVMTALGAIPTVVPFAQTVDAVKKRVVDCAVTGTLSGNEIGLADTTSYLHALPLNWGVSIFAANAAAWDGLSPEDRQVITEGLRKLERDVWTSAEKDTTMGIQCNVGSDQCRGVPAKAMRLVPSQPRDEATVRKVLIDAVLPRWAERCGKPCIESWNSSMAPATGIIFDAAGRASEERPTATVRPAP